MNLRSGYVLGQGILPPQARPIFEEGVGVIFRRWTALALAIENEWGGAESKQKAEALFQEVLQWFYRKREHYADELEELLDDAILQDFNVEAEDDSPRLVSQALIQWYTNCLQGNFADLEKWRVQESAAAKSRQVAMDRDGMEVDGDDSSSDEDDEGEDDDMQEDGAGPSAPQQPQQQYQKPEPIIDEDGFTMVQKKGRGRR